MDLYIYSPDIVQAGVIDDYRSLRWRRQYFEPGEIELHCPATDENLAMLQQDYIIHRIDRSEAAIIESVNVDETDDGDEITVKGRMASSMLDQRVVYPTLNFWGTAEAAMRRAVLDNAVNSRPIAHLAVGNPGGYFLPCAIQTTGKEVLAVLESIGRASMLGFRVRLDVPNTRWVFEVYSGVNRSVAQTTRPYVLFSDDFNNISKPAYAMSTTGYKNYAYVAGQGVAGDRVVVEVDQTGGAPRRELWVDARDLQQGDGVSDADYQSQLSQRGIEKLAAAAKSESFSADAVNTENFEYLIDWDLGDIVSFEKWGLRLDQRVTEVEEVDEGGVFTVTPVCGSPLPEKLDLGSDT